MGLGKRPTAEGGDFPQACVQQIRLEREPCERRTVSPASRVRRGGRYAEPARSDLKLSCSGTASAVPAFSTA
jgi:hypothetical protein